MQVLPLEKAQFNGIRGRSRTTTTNARGLETCNQQQGPENMAHVHPLGRSR